MKKLVIFCVFLIAASLSVSAQGFYFDVGLGLGKGWTKLNGTDMVDAIKTDGGKVNEVALDFGLKAGYGPFGKIPLYVVGEFSGMSHKIYDNSNYIQFNSFIIGPGLIFYPAWLIQLGVSAGYSFVANETDIPMRMYDSKGGFAWNVSAALDFGNRNHGCLVGLKYFNANNTLETSNADENASMISIFVKYTYRKKVPLSFNKKDK
jgi:hypothetical protein